jgi:hypothetical protein
MDKIAGDQSKIMLESDGCNHRVNATYRLASPLQVGEDSAGKFGTRLIEDQDFGGRNVGERNCLSFLMRRCLCSPLTTSITVSTAIV